MTGRRFGRLVVFAKNEFLSRHNKHLYWECLCDCGLAIVTSGIVLRRGQSLSCGCLQRERQIASVKTHGLSRSPEYRVWASMKMRCAVAPDNPVRHWENYGGRGIYVCDRWRGSFAAFIADMGRRPSSKHSIERVDVDKWYEPGNCVWALPAVQSINKRTNVRVTLDGTTKTLTEWARGAGMSPAGFKLRLSKGMTGAELFRPSRRMSSWSRLAGTSG